jgi:hypothetical protein
MDADDIMAATRLQEQLDFLSSHPDVGVVGTQFSYFSGDDRLLPSPRLPSDHSCIVDHLEVGRLALVHASLMFRTDIVRSIGAYRISGIGEDWDLFLRLSEVTNLANIDNKLYLWRIHAGNINLAKISREQFGIRYAMYCSWCRRNHVPEPDEHDFAARPVRPFSAVANLRAARALLHYRLGLACLGDARRIAALTHFTAAGFFAPDRLLRRLLSRPRSS